MKKDIRVAADVRESRGKNEARRMRAAGKIPAVVYGAYQDPVAIAIDPKAVLQIMRSGSGYNTIFDIAIGGGETTPVMLADEQFDPLKGNLLHVDLKRIDLTKRIRVTIPVLTQGDSRGVKEQSGLMELVNRNVEIECLPNEIPENFTIDVTELMLGQARRAGELPMSGSMKLLSPADAVLAHVIAPRAEETPAAAATPEAAAPAAAEPEVVKKGKKEEEGESKKK